jgi:hypothetical protein
MKKSFAYVLVLCACGGTGDTTIPDGSDNDGGSNGDVATNDVTTQDVTSNDVVTNDVVVQDAPIDVNNFNPANVNGLVLWLEADVSSSITLVTPDAGPQKITKWADQTIHHNDAAGLLQFFGRNPSVKSSAINKLPAVHFDQQGANVNTGQMLTVLDNVDTSLEWGTGDFFVAVVGDFDNNPSNGQSLGVGLFYSKAIFNGINSAPVGLYLYGNLPSSSVNPTVGMIFSTSNTANDFVTTSTAYNNGNPHMFAIRRRGANLDLLVDSASVASSTGNGVDVSAAKTSVRIGADGDANLFRLDGDIGEMLAVKGVLSQSDEQGLVSYLKTKWATP